MRSPDAPKGATVSNPALTGAVTIDGDGTYRLPIGRHDFGAPEVELGFSLPADTSDHFNTSSITLDSDGDQYAVVVVVTDFRQSYEGFRLWVY